MDDYIIRVTGFAERNFVPQRQETVTGASEIHYGK